MSKPSRLNAQVASRIFEIRGQRVMLDADLAEVYGVRTKALVQAVKRNAERFSSDFLFQLTEQDVMYLKSQNVTSSCFAPDRWGGRRTMPYAFSEQGVAMLSSALRSPRAIAVNIAIMRAFVRLRALAGMNAELARKLDELERKVAAQGQDIADIVRVIRQLAAPPEARSKRPIGFVA